MFEQVVHPSFKIGYHNFVCRAAQDPREFFIFKNDARRIVNPPRVWCARPRHRCEQVRQHILRGKMDADEKITYQAQAIHNARAPSSSPG